MTEVEISYADPETGQPVKEIIRIFEDQLQHFLEFAQELDEQTVGY